MKKILSILTVAFAMAAMVACEKDNTDNNGGQQNNGNAGNHDEDTFEEWVDLGLPSGLLWATCDVGASSPEEVGNLYAWGETTTKEVYDWDTYRYCLYGNPYMLTKYCDNYRYGYQDFTDSLTVLEPMDDAATAALGDTARTPTIEEWQELIDNTTFEWSTLNNVRGYMFTGPNGKRIFLPSASGDCRYWSSSLGISGSYWAMAFVIDRYFNNTISTNELFRLYGFPVRAVRNGQNQR